MTKLFSDIDWMQIQDKVRELLELGMTTGQVMGLLEKTVEALKKQGGIK